MCQIVPVLYICIRYQAVIKTPKEFLCWAGSEMISDEYLFSKGGKIFSEMI